MKTLLSFIRNNRKQLLMITIFSPIVFPAILIGFTYSLLIDSFLAGTHIYSRVDKWVLED